MPHLEMVLSCTKLQWLSRLFTNNKVNYMATRPKVPEGKSRFLTTTQKEIVEGAFHVGYTTTWDSFQKEVKYTTPKKP